MTKRLGIILLTIAMVVTYAAPVNASRYELTEESPWYASISEMLATGEYEEGVVVVGIDMSKAKRSNDPGSALETKKFRSATDELIYVDSDENTVHNDFISWLRGIVDRLSGGEQDSICITSIRRSDMTTSQMLEILASDDSVVFAEPNYISKLESQDDDNQTNNASGSSTSIADTKDVSGQQWSSSEDTALHAANKALDVSLKVPGWPVDADSNMDHEIIVAVVDMPVDFSNPDLADRAYTFSPELKSKLGCDDHGFNAIWDSKNGKLEYLEGADHGTHVAGIIGASWNGKGISGVGSKVKLISVQNSYEGTTSLIDSLRGYNFMKEAIESGVKIQVANNSWAQAQSSRALDAAITELGKHGVTSFFAAGNDNEELNTSLNTGGLLEDNPYAIVVASTTPAGELADSSCYGKGVVTLGAPGAGILSCVQSQSAHYMPFMASTNKVYENFEGLDPLSVRVTQVGFSTVDYDGISLDMPDPDKEVVGSEGVVVSGKSEMGFEGEKVLKINVDKSALGGGGNNNVGIKIEFGDVSGQDVKAGDYVGLVYGGKTELEPVNIVDTESGSFPAMATFDKSNRNCWNTHEYELQEGINNKNLTLVFQALINDADELYLDALGIGNELQPYAFKSGTSMASPAAAGAAAVIASRHYSELSGLSKQDSAEELANLVRSSVRPLASLSGLTSTGGIIDLTVDAKKYKPTEQPGPDIADISVSGKEVKITGHDFGSAGGSVKLSKYVVAAETDISASVTSWSDSKVNLKLDKDFEGIIEAVLTSANGKPDTIIKYISKSSNLLEKDHHIGTDTGDPFVFNDPGQTGDSVEVLGDFETYGLLVAGDDKLYYMPQIIKIENNPAYKSMYCYDPSSDSWSKCPAYPKWIKLASAAWLDGKLYVKGTSMEVDDSGSIPYSDSDREEPDEVYIYSYTPGDSAWKKCSSEGVASEHTLFATDSKLMLAGVRKEELFNSSDEGYPSVRNYSPSKGGGKALGFSPSAELNPKVVYAGGHIYLCEYEYFNTLYMLDSSMSADLDDGIEFPEFYQGADIRLEEEPGLTKDYEFALTSYEDMVILVGPAANDGSSDIYILKAGEKEFSPYSKRVSDAELLMPSAAVLNGRLYVIASSDFEPDKRIFRSTALPEPEKIKITYDLNGGIFDGSSSDIIEEYKRGTVISIHAAPVRDGYKFLYWKGSEYQAGDKYTVTEDHTFTAQWEKVKGSANGDGETKSKHKVRTGDEVNTVLWITIALMTALMLTAMAIRCRRRS